MNRLLVHLTFSFLLLTAYAGARQAADGNTWARYKPGKLGSVIRAHTDPSESREKAVDLGSDPVRACVTYTGRSRPTPESKRRFISFYMESLGTPRDAEKFSTEMLFVEDGAEFWLPVQDVLLPHFRKELKAGERVTVFANWIGITYPEPGGGRQHVFLINEFEKAEVSGAARAAAAPWGTLTGPDRDFTVNFPVEPRRDEFLGRSGRLARSYTVHMDTMMLVLGSEDSDYPPGSPFADSLSPAFERKMRATARGNGWKIVGVRRLSKSAAEVEAWERSHEPEGYVHSIARTHVRNGRVYDLQCRSMYVGREVDRNICNRFLSSFRVTGPPR